MNILANKTAYNPGDFILVEGDNFISTPIAFLNDTLLVVEDFNKTYIALRIPENISRGTFTLRVRIEELGESLY